LLLLLLHLLAQELLLLERLRTGRRQGALGARDAGAEGGEEEAAAGDQRRRRARSGRCGRGAQAACSRIPAMSSQAMP
jgi:hypothetical protein